MLRYLSSTKQILQVQGPKVFLHKLKKFLFYSDYNTDTKKIIKKYSADYNIFIDIGTNVGAIVLDIANHFSKSICFEPSTQNYDKFMENLKASKLCNIIPYKCALSDTKGIRKLFLSPDSSERHRLYETPNEKCTSEDVEVNTLDDILETLEISEKVIIKMDVEGSELNVLKGSRKILQKDCVIISEFSPRLMNVNNTNPSDYVLFLKKMGYSFFDLKEKPIKNEYLDRLCILGKNKIHVVDDFLIKKCEF